MIDNAREQNRHWAACLFLAGSWRYLEQTILVSRDSLPIQVQTTYSFPSTVGNIEIQQLSFGAQLYGEYCKASEPSQAFMTISLEEIVEAKSQVTATIGFAPKGKVRTDVILSDGSLCLVDPDIQSFDGGFHQEADPKNEICDSFVTRLIFFHPLRTNLWIQVVCHFQALLPDASGVLLKTEIWHSRQLNKNIGKRTPSTADKSVPSKVQSTKRQPDASSDSFAREVELTNQLNKAICDLNSTREAYEELTNTHEEVTDEILDLEFEFLSKLQRFGRNAVSDFPASKVQALYRKSFDLTDDIEQIENSIADLEDLVLELEEELESEHNEWVETKYAHALEIVADSIAPEKIDSASRLFHLSALETFSSEAILVIKTYLRLSEMFYEPQADAPLDFGPLVAAMSKVCERILSEFLEPKCKQIAIEGELINSLKKHADSVPIPENEEKGHNIGKGAIVKVLKSLKPKGQQKWSGVRNCAIVLLLFGRKYQVGRGSDVLVDNPLQVYGDDEERDAFRLDLLKFQQARNGYIHHDVASREDAQKVERQFLRCIHGFHRVLWGISATPP